jgi:hypothetical protein
MWSTLPLPFNAVLAEDAVMSFFSSHPDPKDARPEPSREPYQRPDPRFGPPDDELGTTLPLSWFLTRTETAALVVRNATAYGSGCLFSIGWVTRRARETAAEWDRKTQSVHRRSDYRQDSNEFTGLRFGVILSDGEVAVSHSGLRRGSLDPDSGVVLQLRSGSGSGGPERASGDSTLWLHPIPPAGDLTLIVEWKELGIEETEITIDASALREASRSAEPFWRD